MRAQGGSHSVTTHSELKTAIAASPPLVRAMRPHHWLKNLLVFLPVLLAHQTSNPAVLWSALLAFVSLSCAASAIYLVNDLVDVESDRKHPTKRFRPLASGALSRHTAMMAAPGLIALAYLVPLALMPAPAWFLVALTAYLIVSPLYVFFLKRKLLVDVLGLSGLHTLRIIAGNAATHIELSSWLLAFAMFVFFSLALVKRYAELRDAGDDVGLRGVGRGYQAGDLETISQLGISSAIAAAVILVLYVDSRASTGLYKTPQLIWLICPIVLYVLARLWVLARRGQMSDDPLMFIIRDWRSQLMGVITICLILAARYL
jgi:4-hydroxybenzoate polyprenyltransferase